MKRTIIFIAFILTLLPYTSANAELEPVIHELDSVQHVFNAHEYVYNNVTLPYREDKICQSENEKSSLVIFLHGGSKLGNDNISQLNSSGVDDLAKYLYEKNIAATLLVPQCASDRLWNETKAVNGTYMSDVLKAWIDDYIINNNIDTDKIYILGASAGGGGVWRMASDYIGFFAAAMPCAVTPLNVKSENLLKTPLCVVAGDNDNIGRATEIQTYTDNLKAHGGEVTFTILPESDHQTTCMNAWAENRLDWLFAHTKRNFGVPKILTLTPNVENGAVEISLSAISDNASVFVAAYDTNSTLTAAKQVAYDNNTEFTNVDISLENAEYIKAFAWEIDTLTMLTDCKKVNVD